MEKDRAKKFFSKDVSERDRAIFECGITLGALYHQFQGTPLINDEKTVHALENAMELTMLNQPWIEQVRVNILPSDLKLGKKVYDYTELSGKNLEADVIAVYGKTKVVGRIQHIEELDFPLMFIEEISD